MRVKEYIIFEGIDGSGKSTIAKKVYNYLKNKYSVKLIREPGGTLVSEKIRKIIAQEKLLPQTQLFLFLAARTELYSKISNLKENVIVMDRSYLSTFAYQTVLMNLSIGKIKNLHSIFNIPVTKGLAFVLLADPITIRKRLDTKHIFHKMLNDKTLHQINQRYKSLPKIFKNLQFIYLDSRQSIEYLYKKVIMYINARLQD